MKIKTVEEINKEFEVFCAQYENCAGCPYVSPRDCKTPFMRQKMVEHVAAIRAEIESARHAYIHLISEDAVSWQSNIDALCVRGLDMALAIIDKESE